MLHLQIRNGYIRKPTTQSGHVAGENIHWYPHGESNPGPRAENPVS